jgi:hypothetical protein
MGGVVSSIGNAVSDVASGVGNVIGGAVNTVEDLGAGVDRAVRKDLPGGWTTAALLAAGAYYAPEIGAWISSSGAPIATSSEVAAADAGAGIAGSTGTGVVASPVASGSVAATNLGTLGSSGTGLTMGGGGLGLTGGTTANLAGMGGAQGLTGLSTAGTTMGAAGGALAAGGLGAGLGLSSAATGAGLGTALGAGAAGAGLGGLTASQLGTLGLIQGGLGLAGGLLSGSQATDALNTAAQQQQALANKTLQIGQFKPVGVTTNFGTSNFQVDPTTGQITQAGYTLSPQLQATQEGVLGGLRQNLTDAQTQAALGRSYLAQNPQDVAANWLSQQQALLAPAREQAWAKLNQGNYNQGTTGLKVAQGGNLQAANPYASALANAQAQQDLTLASQAQQQGQNAVTFGQGLLSSAYAPLQAGLNTASGLEQLGQMPFGLSTNLANLSSTAGARQASNYATAMGGGIQNQLAANSYSPWATALQGTASNPLASYGLMKLFA